MYACINGCLPVCGMPVGVSVGRYLSNSFGSVRSGECKNACVITRTRVLSLQ